MIEYKEKCPICNRETTFNNQSNHTWYYCEHCGNFATPSFWPMVSNKNNSFNLFHLSTYLFYHKGEKRAIIGGRASFGDKYDEIVEKYEVTPDIVENWYPKQFSDKIKLTLKWLSSKAKFFGDSIIIDSSDLQDVFFLVNTLDVVDETKNVQWADELKFLLEYFETSGYIKIINEENAEAVVDRLSFFDLNEIEIQLTIKGYGLVENNEKDISNNKNIFVSMAFNEQTKEIREAIRKGIINAGFSPEFIDEIIHNHQIVPEMLRLIRECRILVLETSEKNFGAYYEAGYAMGLGKEVIVCCKKDVFESENRPHFDIIQKQILIWENLEDLSNKLREWIIALTK